VITSGFWRGFFADVAVTRLRGADHMLRFRVNGGIGLPRKRCIMRAMVLPLVGLLALPGFATQAQDVSVYAGAALSFSSGAENKGTRQDLNGYVEGEMSGFYLGVSADIYSDSVNDEIDPYFGYRGETAGGLSYDASYTHYFYPNDGGACCGDIYLSLGVPVGDALTINADADYYPEDELSAASIGLDYALNDRLTLSGSFGLATQTVGDATQNWELAAAYKLGDTTAVKLHYYDGSDFKPYVGLDLTWDTTLLGQ